MINVLVDKSVNLITTYFVANILKFFSLIIAGAVNPAVGGVVQATY